MLEVVTLKSQVCVVLCSIQQNNIAKLIIKNHKLLCPILFHGSGKQRKLILAMTDLQAHYIEEDEFRISWWNQLLFAVHRCVDYSRMVSRGGTLVTYVFQEILLHTLSLTRSTHQR